MNDKQYIKESNPFDKKKELIETFCFFFCEIIKKMTKKGFYLCLRITQYLALLCIIGLGINKKLLYSIYSFFFIAWKIQNKKLFCFYYRNNSISIL